MTLSSICHEWWLGVGTFVVGSQDLDDGGYRAVHCRKDAKYARLHEPLFYTAVGESKDSARLR